MFQLEYFDEPAGKWRRLGEDGNEFERPSLAWDEAVEAAKIGPPYDGARYRVVTEGAEHQDDCGLGIGAPQCDCGTPVVVELEGRVSVANGMVTSVMSVGELSSVPFTLTHTYRVEERS